MPVASGNIRANHRYIARVRRGNGYRYFYTTEEINAYKKEQSGVRKKFDNTPSDGVAKAVPIRHPKKPLSTNASGPTVSGYRPGGGKPSGVSDETWAKWQRLWSTQTTSGRRVVVRRKKKRRKSPIVVTRKSPITVTSRIVQR